MNEPRAAAIAYGLDKKVVGERKAFSRSKQLQVISPTFEDFNNRLANYFVSTGIRQPSFSATPPYHL
jgi:hypothetical protein